ncbi:uncharacterized protein C4orf50 homolog isoform X1 [Mustela erminea]|uniref:uncharacterized protein C4orf50 homolog isoform X1 n=1 Tax=Mustela erminea TaxID=36723 RepID=UPI00138734DD|nr:uncharacterized protein C4orf50 homolog isoform X1 [Mustela erminea]XP_032189683.1 uncharacterized protein C4orf50 homolog isoform X1 [Mustela erminea]
MEPTATGRTEKSFSYVVRAPSSDGFDVMNVDVKIDTCWVFQDVEDSGEEQDCPVDEAAGSPDVDTGTLRKQLESSEQKLLATVDQYMMSESELRSRIQELELSERHLLRTVEQLGARVTQERSATVRAQETLQALRRELASQVLEKERAARRQRWQLQRLRERLRRKDEALGRQAAALERCRQTQRLQLGLVREQERGLREQVQRLERDVRHLCRAAGLLLAELDVPAPGSPGRLGPACPRGDPGEAAELRALQARAERGEREREEAARRLREQRATERRLRVQLEDLRCYIYELKLSEIGLQGQVEDLAQQNQSLREALAAQAPGESARSNVAAGHCSPDTLSRIQDEPPSLPREDTQDAGRRQGLQATVCSAGGPGLGGSAGQSSEGRCSWDCVGAGPDPSVLETMHETLEDVTGSDGGPPTPAEPNLDEQTLLLICGCPPRQCRDSSLLPVELAWISEQRLATTQAQGSFLLVQTSPLPPWGPARNPCSLLPPLLLQEASPQDSQMQQVLDAWSLPAPRAIGQPCWNHHWAKSPEASLCQECPQTSSHRFPRRGPRDLEDTWKEGGGPEWRTEEEGERRAWHRRGREGGPLSDVEEEHPTARVQGAPKPSPAGAQVLAGQGEEETLVWSGKALCLREESPGYEGQEEKEEEAVPLEGSSLGYEDSPEEPGPMECAGQGTLFSVAEEGLSPRLGDPIFPPKGTECTRNSWASSEGPGSSELRLDKFEKEMEACFQQLSILELGGELRWPQASMLAGESTNFAWKWPSCQGKPSSQQALGNQGLDVCLAREVKPGEASEEVRPEETEALGTSAVLPEMVPDLDDVRLGPEWPSERGWNWPPRALERQKRRFHQLIAGLKRERSQVLHDNAELWGDRERFRRKVSVLEKERDRNGTKIATLEREKSMLLGDISHLKGELDQCWQVISDLEDCNGKSYGKISELEEENEKLKRHTTQLQKALWESLRKSKGVMERVTLGNQELKVLISELGVGYKELMKSIVLGIEDTVRAFSGENAHLLHRIRVLETEVALGESTAVRRVVRGEEGPWGESKMRGDKGTAVEKGVQVTQLSGQLTAGAHGPPMEEKSGAGGRCMGPSLGMENSRYNANSTLSLVWGSAEVSSIPQGHIHGAGVKETYSEEEKERPWCCADPVQALTALNNGPQLRDPEADPPKEDLRVRVGQLQHRVLTLQCQLRDQTSAHRQLQEALGEAARLREQLQGQLDELQKKQHEANFAVAPLKAKLASLVQKCRERNHLITHLLRELRRHGLEDQLLSEMAQTMVDDVALAEYAATFPASGLPETSHQLVVEPEKAAAVRAQKYHLNPQMDSVLIQRPLHSEPWPVPKAEWPAQTARLHSLKLPLPSGWMPAPGVCPAADPAEPALPSQCLKEDGGPSCPVPQADGLPPPSELLSPARILAFHKELRQSICSNSQVHKSPLEL